MAPLPPEAPTARQIERVNEQCSRVVREWAAQKRMREAAERARNSCDRDPVTGRMISQRKAA
jgi:hypothetical protein